jgi:uncharacterized membrane protein
MKTNALPLITIGLPLITLLAGLTPLATAAASSPCERTADQMFQACHFDIRDDLRVARANCLNLADAAERRACRQAAQSALREDAELCGAQREARRVACELLAERRYDPDPLLDPAIPFVDPDTVDAATANPYVSIVAGHTHVLRAGEEGEETVVVHVTGAVREIQGVPCRVVVDVVVMAEEDEHEGTIDYLPVEVTDDWFAQDIAGNLYYCGEIARNFEDGILVDLDGSFEAGRDFAKGGLLIMARPEPGVAHRQEFALGEAEDIVQYLDLAAVPRVENPGFPCAPAGGCLQTFDFAPLDPEATEYKYYLPGTGFVLAEALEDGVPTGEREQLVCVGDSLDVLYDDACAIEDPEALIERLCELSPAVFCDVDDD